jgi:hypothetical protein
MISRHLSGIPVHRSVLEGTFACVEAQSLPPRANPHCLGGSVIIAAIDMAVLIMTMSARWPSTRRTDILPHFQSRSSPTRAELAHRQFLKQTRARPPFLLNSSELPSNPDASDHFVRLRTVLPTTPRQPKRSMSCAASPSSDLGSNQGEPRGSS